MKATNKDNVVVRDVVDLIATKLNGEKTLNGKEHLWHQMELSDIEKAVFCHGDDYIEITAVFKKGGDGLDD